MVNSQPQPCSLGPLIPEKLHKGRHADIDANSGNTDKTRVFLDVSYFICGGTVIVVIGDNLKIRLNFAFEPVFQTADACLPKQAVISIKTTIMIC